MKEHEMDSSIQRYSDDLDLVLSGRKNLVIVLHNNPDPDALASAMALGHLARQCHGLQVSITYHGLIGRAENQAMVRELKITLKKMSLIKFSAYDCVAILDTQPGAGNNALPADIRCNIVIDHHPRRKKLDADCIHIDEEAGATATLLIEAIRQRAMEISADLATALAYAIRSETQDLGREAGRRDIDAYLHVYPRASIRKLARITHPKLPRSYFVTLASALQKAVTFRHFIVAHLGDVPIPEAVGETADLLLRHKHISWTLCTGRYKGSLILSLRSSNAKAKAGRIIKRLVPDRNLAGGHDMFAGGFIPVHGCKPDEITAKENKLTDDFSRIMGNKDAEWKGLL